LLARLVLPVRPGPLQRLLARLVLPVRPGPLQSNIPAGLLDANLYIRMNLYGMTMTRGAPIDLAKILPGLAPSNHTRLILVDCLSGKKSQNDTSDSCSPNEQMDLCCLSKLPN
jgi:hypothetical protein